MVREETARLKKVNNETSDSRVLQYTSTFIVVCGTDKLDQGLRNLLLPCSGIHLQNKNCRLFYSAIANTAEFLSCPDDLLAPFTAVTDQLIRIYV